MIQEDKSITCPLCGNRNQSVPNNCTRCGLDLMPIYNVMRRTADHYNANPTASIIAELVSESRSPAEISNHRTGQQLRFSECGGLADAISAKFRAELMSKIADAIGSSDDMEAERAKHLQIKEDKVETIVDGERVIADGFWISIAQQELNSPTLSVVISALANSDLLIQWQAYEPVLPTSIFPPPNPDAVIIAEREMLSSILRYLVPIAMILMVFTALTAGLVTASVMLLGITTMTVITRTMYQKLKWPSESLLQDIIREGKKPPLELEEDNLPETTAKIYRWLCSIILGAIAKATHDEHMRFYHHDAYVACIDNSTSWVKGPEQFRSSATYEEMLKWAGMCKEVIEPALVDREHELLEVLSNLDKQLTLTLQQKPISKRIHELASYQQVYDGFYGHAILIDGTTSNIISLEQRGSIYKILHGNHRIFVAKKVGLVRIRAQVYVYVDLWHEQFNNLLYILHQ